MTAIARALTRAFATAAEVEVVKQLLLFSLAGLFVSVLLMTYGLDLSPGFFSAPTTPPPNATRARASLDGFVLA